MRKLSDLQALATLHGVEHDDTFGSRELMDALRDKLGVADPELNIDPMKAKDLKEIIAWGSDRPFEKVVRLYGNHRYRVEPKLDGARVRVVFGTTKNSIPTGRRSDMTFGYIDRADNFPHVSNLVVPELAGTVIDCEVMVPGSVFLDEKKGWTKGPLNSVMAVLNINPAQGVARQAKHGWAKFHAFDVLAVSGDSVMHMPLRDRRAVLTKVLRVLEEAWHTEPGAEHDTNPFPFNLLAQYGVSEESLQSLLEDGFEGGMIKNLDSTYVPGGRTDAWLKVKRYSTGDFFIIGSTPGKGRNEGKVGSLMLAYLGDDGKPVYCADMRGFDDKTCDWLTDPETGAVKAEHIGRVCEVMGQGRTKNERIRHPHFVRWREDKTFKDCTRDQLLLFSEV